MQNDQNVLTKEGKYGIFMYKRVDKVYKSFGGKAMQSVEEILKSLELPEEDNKRRKHVLVVDDDVRMLRLIKKYLDNDYDVATAVNGKVALKFLQTKHTDLILLDYEMPIEDGPSVLKKIRKDEKLSKLPVVFLTGVSSKEKIQEVLQLRPQGYLLKPINRQKLLLTIEKNIG